MLEAELSGNPFAHFLLAKQVPPDEAGSISIVGYLWSGSSSRKYGDEPGGHRVDAAQGYR